MSIPEISVVQAAARLSGINPPRLIDVREVSEFVFSQVIGAELLPLSQWPKIAIEKLSDPTQALLILCHHGHRSAQATEFLLHAGFSDVTNILGGIDAWSAEVDFSIPRY